MVAIAFDLTIDDLKRHYPKPSYLQGYADIKVLLKGLGFEWTQGSVYVYKETGAAGAFAVVYSAIEARKKLDWFRMSVRDIRAFKVEDWSDFTGLIKDL
jgi:virulence-associated protein VapD